MAVSSSQYRSTESTSKWSDPPFRKLLILGSCVVLALMTTRSPSAIGVVKKVVDSAECPLPSVGGRVVEKASTSRLTFAGEASDLPPSISSKSDS